MSEYFKELNRVRIEMEHRRIDRINMLRKQRDELLAACKMARDKFIFLCEYEGALYYDEIKQLDTAIANVEGNHE